MLRKLDDVEALDIRVVNSIWRCVRLECTEVLVYSLNLYCLSLTAFWVSFRVVLLRCVSPLLASLVERQHFSFEYSVTGWGLRNALQNRAHQPQRLNVAG